jgi:hypothetical protein
MLSAMGHQDAFLLPRLSARYRFCQGTLAGPRATGKKRRLQIFPPSFRTGRFNPNWSSTPREGAALQDHRRRGVISTGYRPALFTDPAKLNRQHSPKLGSSGSRPGHRRNFRSRNLSKVDRSNVGHATRGWLSFLQRFDRRSAAKGLFAVAVPPLFFFSAPAAGQQILPPCWPWTRLLPLRSRLFMRRQQRGRLAPLTLQAATLSAVSGLTWPS